jgi:cyclic 2,3-diphosphoglycerate synthetase
VDVVALIDGEHLPDVTRWALRTADESGRHVVAALLVGGVEKLPDGAGADLGATEVVRAGDDPAADLGRLLDRVHPDGVLDLSDEPVVGNELRMLLASVALARGVAYLGGDFSLDPPLTEPPLPAPTVAVIGSGKRVGKTAIGGQVARVAVSMGLHPVVVAMGRGGPERPEVAGPGDVTLDALLARAGRGEHAASDFLEDALTAGVVTVGARRAGGGLAGRPYATNVAAAAARAVELGGNPVVLEGSGSAMPTVPWDAGVLVVPGGLRPSPIAGYLGPLRVLLSDLVVFIMESGPQGPENLSALDSHIRRLRTDVQVAVAELTPVPLENVRGKDAFLATTASPGVSAGLARKLERTAGCHVTAMSNRLADRAGLEEDLAGAPAFDVLLTELKAAAVDVAARRAVERGARVVFLDNRPVGIGGDGDLDDLLAGVIASAGERAAARSAAAPL